MNHSGNYRHGLSRTRTWNIYVGIRQRCSDKSGKNVKWYKGIKNHWDTFEDFYKDMGECPPGMTIDRINSSGDYCRANCRWATPAEQVRNSSQTRMIEYKGRKQCLKDWATELGIKYTTLRARLDVAGYTVEQAFTTTKWGRRI